MKKLPEELKCIGDVMSNFDHEIESGAADRLKKGKVYGEYPAVEFFAKVWWDGNVFCAEIMRYCSHVDTLEADTLDEIMSQASSRYGSE
jgi:hypothetical protein